ncbi:unnamed protein product [Phaedon cochleariae]|uniref:Ig-like domain-containing protein n=1 Tax=Phaedon cochleariae TaxID=80249 RepID=A0A9P0DA64_PHACE|nr:unnamed protein product [Phaedon cochleariae]
MKADEKWLIAVFAVFVLFQDCLSLKEVRIQVPTAVLLGHQAVLKCFFDSEGDKLYSVKWYHNAAEFFRYNPSIKNPIRQFKLKGFYVDETESDATQVVLKHVTKAMSGKFSCEVTADQPSFFTDMKTAQLEVIDPPKSDPFISGAKARYKVGEYLKAICTVDKSDPAVNLTWHVNGRIMDVPQVHRYKKVIEGDYTSSYSTLRFKITEPLFDSGKLKIRCSADLFGVWHRSSEKTIELKLDDREDSNTAPAWLASTTSTEYSHEIYWMQVARNAPESTLIFEDSGNDANNRATTFPFNEAMIATALTICLHCR